MAAIVVVAGAVFLWTMRVPTVAGGVKSIAVIPLQNLSGDPAQEYFYLGERLRRRYGRHAAAGGRRGQSRSREWTQLGPRTFEELLSEMWRGLGWQTVLPPPVRDGGFDIRAIRNEKALAFAIYWRPKLTGLIGRLG